jgi:hypothetical protein
VAPRDCHPGRVHVRPANMANVSFTLVRNSADSRGLTV